MKNYRNIFLTIAVWAFVSVSVSAQTTEFTYQGDLQNGGVAATGTYDFEFLLFDAVTGGAQNGSTLTRSSVTVTNGIFSVKLDFGANFPGANRFLELHVRQTGGGAFTPLTPRQAVTSAPYSVKSLNAATAENVTGFSIAGSNNVIAGVGAGTFNTGSNNAFYGTSAGQNNTSGQNNSFFGLDAGFTNTTGTLNSYFGLYAGRLSNGFGNSFFGVGAGQADVGGNSNTIIGTFANVGSPNLQFATAIGAGALVSADNTVVLGRPADTVQVPGILNSATQYNIGGNRVLSAPGTWNTFGGFNAGTANIAGTGNSFFGASAGQSSNAHSNSFFGFFSGGSNSSGGANAFFGTGSGSANTGGSNNSFFGTSSGNGNTIGEYNSSLGRNSGISNIDGSFNTFIGYDANPTAGNLTNATAIGAGAIVSQSNSLVLGSNANVGIGTSTPTEKLHVGGSGSVRWSNSLLDGTANGQGGSIELGGTNTIAGLGTPFIDFHYNGIAEDYNIRLINESSGVLGLKGALATTGSITVAGNITVGTVSDGGIPVCFDPQLRISVCGSSLRFKQNVNPFLAGMSLIKRLRPVYFDWRSDGHADMGLIAEEVAEVEPLLTTIHPKNSQIQGVKYDRVGVVLVNAVKEQQTQIEAQQKQIDEQNEIIKKQRADLDALKALVCSQNPAAAACKPQNDPIKGE